MKSKLDAVILFHQTYGVPYNQSPIAEIGEERTKLRFELMKEENEEYQTAVQNNDIVEIADSLGDMLYILCGTIIEHGLQYKIEEVFDEIQNSNMSKLGADGKPIYREDGKVLKGPNYFPPNIAKILFPITHSMPELNSVQRERIENGQPDDVRHEGGE